MHKRQGYQIRVKNGKFHTRKRSCFPWKLGTLWNRSLWEDMGAKNVKNFKKQLDKHVHEKSVKVCTIQIYHKYITSDSEGTWRLNNYCGEIPLQACSCSPLLSQNLCSVTVTLIGGYWWIFWLDQRLLLPCICPASNAQELGQLWVFMQWISTENWHRLSLPSSWSFCPNLIVCNLFLR